MHVRGFWRPCSRRRPATCRLSRAMSAIFPRVYPRLYSVILSLLLCLACEAVREVFYPLGDAILSFIALCVIFRNVCFDAAHPFTGIDQSSPASLGSAELHNIEEAIEGAPRRIHPERVEDTMWRGMASIFINQARHNTANLLASSSMAPSPPSPPLSSAPLPSNPHSRSPKFHTT